MTAKFILAKDLLEKYDVLGHFYSLSVPGAGKIECRSVLEVSSKHGADNHAADAVFIMMNPGSSRPVIYSEQLVNADDISKMTRRLVPTAPDTTQYQIMRVMHHADWRRVRVINLSDIRDPRSESFAERYFKIEEHAGGKVHSVFSPERSEELRQHLSTAPNGPIVCAWGVSDKLNPLIERAVACLSDVSGVTGLAKQGCPDKYFHPLPMIHWKKQKWLDDLLELLNICQKAIKQKNGAK